jgi:hypothetical protein
VLFEPTKVLEDVVSGEAEAACNVTRWVNIFTNFKVIYDPFLGVV